MLALSPGRARLSRRGEEREIEKETKQPNLNVVVYANEKENG